ncbi:hypothetical protein CONLIGDRAFT_650112 [Coniochaeta ligniaria NRRL 30616]|uniref:Uncharacterized protein n=1 Tax=Coniochaeta ligniaria NRRL 30616 TaxID=1408157 RepID=A0A1J7I660_9PEZI|nr:hypothetical protein CONLIGDRAFT_650112 [Coniochaeta ligniaria NRRL 30616]
MRIYGTQEPSAITKQIDHNNSRDNHGHSKNTNSWAVSLNSTLAAQAVTHTTIRSVTDTVAKPVIDGDNKAQADRACPGCLTCLLGFAVTVVVIIIILAITTAIILSHMNIRDLAEARVCKQGAVYHDNLRGGLNHSPEDTD